jgi:hypothetical protein
MASLQPFDLGYPLIRVGGAGDGGYLLPDAHLDQTSVLFSPGVDATWAFESDMAQRFATRSVMCDGSIDEPEDLPATHTFEKLWLSPRTGPGSTSLTDWVTSHALPGDRNLMLQMDIEGAEWAVLRHTPRETLQRFRVIVIEFHGLEAVANLYDATRHVGSVIGKLAADFQVAHAHANNCCGFVRQRGIVVPRVVEVTYLRRDLVREVGNASPVPHPLDKDCVPGNPAIPMDFSWI